MRNEDGLVQYRTVAVHFITIQHTSAHITCNNTQYSTYVQTQLKGRLLYVYYCIMHNCYNSFCDWRPIQERTKYTCLQPMEKGCNHTNSIASSSLNLHLKQQQKELHTHREQGATGNEYCVATHQSTLSGTGPLLQQ